MANKWRRLETAAVGGEGMRGIAEGLEDRGAAGGLEDRGAAGGGSEDSGAAAGGGGEGTGSASDLAARRESDR